MAAEEDPPFCFIACITVFYLSLRFPSFIYTITLPLHGHGGSVYLSAPEETRTLVHFSTPGYTL